MPGGVVDLTPLGLALLPLLLLERAARHAATQHEVDRLPEAVRLAAGVAGPYALALTVVAGVMRGASVHPDAVQTLLGASVLGLLGAGTGVLRGAGLLPRLAGAVPGLVRRAVAPAGAALAALLGAGALLVGVSLVVHLSDATELARATSPGRVGGLGLLLLGALLSPTAAVWGSAFLTGPGIALGTGASAGPFGVHLGALPELPLVAALPAGRPATAIGLLLLLVPVAVGVLAARTARRRAAGTWATLLAAPLAAAGLAALAALSGGALGPGHLSHVGPPALLVGACAAAELLLGMALELGAVRLLAWRTTQARGRA